MGKVFLSSQILRIRGKAQETAERKVSWKSFQINFINMNSIVRYQESVSMRVTKWVSFFSLRFKCTSSFGLILFSLSSPPSLISQASRPKILTGARNYLNSVWRRRENWKVFKCLIFLNKLLSRVERSIICVRLFENWVVCLVIVRQVFFEN